MNLRKKLSVLALFFVAVLAFAGMAQATITVTTTELNGRVVYDTTNVAQNMIRELGRNSEIDISVELSSDVDVTDAQIEATITGLEHDADEATDRTDVFDMVAGVTYVKDLRIKLPSRMEKGKTYRLRLRVEDQSNVGVYKDYFVYVDSDMHGIDVKDVLFSPEYEVQAGHSLLTEVQLRNTGVRNEEDLKVKVSVPDLGISATTIMDELDSDDIDVTEPLFLRIPDCAKAGTYDALITVYYNDGDDMVTDKRTINVVESESCKPSSTTTTGTSKTLISLPATQDVTIGGSEVVFPVLITNAGDSSKTYNVYVHGVSGWGTYRVEPSVSQIVASGDTSPVYVYVTANKDATAGEKSFYLEIKAGSETKQLPLTANLVKPESSLSGLKKVLEVALIIFVVLIVVVGLIIGYNKMKDNEGNDELDDEEQTYY